MKKILVILGPTTTGKTDVALFLADKFNGELVACDSRQVYKNLDIGTGKLPSQEVIIKKGKSWWEIDGVKVWMYDVTDVNEQYTVADYASSASRVISNIVRRGKLPIIVGGTGFYLRILLEGLDNLQIPVDQNLRNKLEKLTLLQVQKKLREISPQKWQEMNHSDRNNFRRILRSIELHSMNPYIGKKKNFRGLNKNFSVLKIGLTAPRQELYKKVDLRIDSWFDQGIVTEVKNLISRGVTADRFYRLGLEYGLIAKFLEGDIKSLEDLKNMIKGKLHGYVRRQLTWFKKEGQVFWFDITDKNVSLKIAKTVHKWYDIPNYYA